MLTTSKKAADIVYKEKIQDWIKEFLGSPHPKLGRPGIVCPFVPRALRMDTIKSVVVHTEGLEEPQIADLVKSYRTQFLTMEPQQGDLAIYKAILLIFPDISGLLEQTALIDRIQQQLKPFFVEEGLMIGEFHEHNESPGLHNPDFRPLRSPIPMLAIRFMTELDLPFLSRSSDDPQVRMRYLNAYLQQMSAINKDFKALATAHAALQIAQSQVANVAPNAKLIGENSSVPSSRCPVFKLKHLLNQQLHKIGF
ncbi:DUF6875 domain-containing protein [Nodosilinea sp. FACHB-13]|uniref:DUF6875 domain-containing protein n=1 Tax=Cyanophyceae TaxID=3028117 RepID=UPI001684BA3E|nr:hypothetical protein [Nodosilinea sp. FACHB-13]MBD2108182.1 hypothetical protein [Nodosilinea sp. FACHB-13]